MDEIEQPDESLTSVKRELEDTTPIDYGNPTVTGDYVPTQQKIDALASAVESIAIKVSPLLSKSDRLSMMESINSINNVRG